jgi:hypothetical protein
MRSNGSLPTVPLVKWPIPRTAISDALAKSMTGCIPFRDSALLCELRVIGTAATTGSRVSNATSPIAFAFSTSAGMSVAGLNGRDLAPAGIASSIK